jgi:hypothetical protein
MKMTVFWNVALCSLVEVYRRFRGAVSIIKTSPCIYWLSLNEERKTVIHKTRFHSQKVTTIRVGHHEYTSYNSAGYSTLFLLKYDRIFSQATTKRM